MDRYAAQFEAIKQTGEGAFVPFVVLGDPSPAESRQIVQALIDAGADALELGIPFSDPLADGPIIQAAMNRALAAGVTPQDCLSLIRDIRQSNPALPIGLLVYANIVHAFGINEFYAQCAAAGVDSVLVADVPVSECEPFRQAAAAAGILPILLCPPNIDLESLAKVAEYGEGYTYLLSRPGVTGTSVAAGRPVGELLQRLREHQAPPTLLGFGISTPEQVHDSITSGADGVICGSAIIQRITDHLPDIDRVIDELSVYTSKMKRATIV